MKLSHTTPEPEPIARAAAVILDGGVVVFPTSGLYGLAADATNRAAVDRVFEIKQRSPDKPLSVLVRDRDALAGIVDRIPAVALVIMDTFWPGGITIVFEAAKHLPPNLTAGTGKIGVRLPRHPVAVALANALDVPITATSANLACRDGCWDIADLDPALAAKADLILDAGPVAGGPGSTIVDVTRNPPGILREGAIPAADILSRLE